MAKIERCQAFHFGYERDQMKVKRKDNKENKKKRLGLRVYSTQDKLNRDGRKIQKNRSPGKTLEHVDCVGWWWWLVHRRVLREREKKKRQVEEMKRFTFFLFSFLFPFVGGVGGATSDVLLE